MVDGLIVKFCWLVAVDFVGCRWFLGRQNDLFAGGMVEGFQLMSNSGLPSC